MGLKFRYRYILPLSQIWIFTCSTCKKSPTEPLLWVNKKQRQTNRYQEYIYERVKELTVKQVSENEKMSEDAVQDIFHKVANSQKKLGIS
jgi:transposase